MCLTTYLAFVIGSYLLLVNLAYLLNRSRHKKFMADLDGNDALVYVVGIVSVIFGLMILTCHNLWVADWPVLITIFAWITLFQGIARLYFPDGFNKFCRQIQAKPNFWIFSLVWLLIGVYLVYQGYELMMSSIV